MTFQHFSQIHRYSQQSKCAFLFMEKQFWGFIKMMSLIHKSGTLPDAVSLLWSTFFDYSSIWLTLCFRWIWLAYQIIFFPYDFKKLAVEYDDIDTKVYTRCNLSQCVCEYGMFWVIASRFCCISVSKVLTVTQSFPFYFGTHSETLSTCGCWQKEGVY